jgi:hypothetical protein
LELNCCGMLDTGETSLGESCFTGAGAGAGADVATGVLAGDSFFSSLRPHIDI